MSSRTLKLRIMLPFQAAVCGALCGVTSTSLAQSVSDYAVRVSATVQTNPAQISLSWPADPNATGYEVYRKLRDATSWGVAQTLAADANNYVDTNVSVGGAYEYRFSKSASAYYGEGYIYAGIHAALTESRGKVVLLVDNTCTASLSNELARLQHDLVGDGWTVLRHDVARMAIDPANTSSAVWTARSNELANVKALVTADYKADPTNVKAVFLFGHLPVPYSGNISPDDHLDHVGAWPADGFYGSINGTWPDSVVNDATASDSRNWNVPGDGKLDSSYWPNLVLAVPVGRMDLANLPAFPQSEVELLRQYLNKNHSFRQKLITAQRRGLIDDNFGLSTGEPLAAGGWRNFAAFFGASNSVASSDWFDTLATNSYLWGYGCGGGTFTSCSGIGDTASFVTNDPQVVFTLFFGSYFGDWDSQDNFLRAALGTKNYTLTSVWSGRPHWICHHMGLGETIGFSTLVTQNNNDLYDFNNFAGSVHIALMGDPTLRMHIVSPPSGLTVVTNASGGVDLNWLASPDTTVGYHVYRAPTAVGPFTRLNTDLIAGTAYTDETLSTHVYMVRAVKLEVSASGSYYNASQGIFQSLDGSAGAPQVQLYQPTNNTVFPMPAVVQLKADTFDPANCITNVSFYVNGQKLGDAPGPFYSLTWSNAPAGQYVLVAQASCSTGLVTNSSPVNLNVVGLSPTLAITSSGSGSFTITGTGLPGYTYHIQSNDDLNSTNWQTIGSVTVDLAGHLQFNGSAGPGLQFYRTVYP